MPSSTRHPSFSFRLPRSFKHVPHCVGHAPQEDMNVSVSDPFCKTVWHSASWNYNVIRPPSWISVHVGFASILIFCPRGFHLRHLEFLFKCFRRVSFDSTIASFWNFPAIFFLNYSTEVEIKFQILSKQDTNLKLSRDQNSKTYSLIWNLSRYHHIKSDHSLGSTICTIMHNFFPSSSLKQFCNLE